jgi:hypothetical protein
MLFQKVKSITKHKNIQDIFKEKIMDIDRIKNEGAIKQLDDEIRKRLWDIKSSTEEAAKTQGKTFYKLPGEISKITNLIKEINTLYESLLIVREYK